MIGKKRRWTLPKGVAPTDFDKKIMAWERKGRLVPTRNLIKTPEQIEGIRKAGVINTAIRVRRIIPHLDAVQSDRAFRDPASGNAGIQIRSDLLRK